MMQRKVTVQQAQIAIENALGPTVIENIRVEDAISRVVQKDVYAQVALPPFANSAVDGYALGSIGLEFEVVSVIGAGDLYREKLALGQACRIMTGAQIPDGTTAIAMQEHVRCEGERVYLTKPARENDHIRFAGEDVEKGQLVMKAGTQLSSKHVGLLCALGMTHVPVVRAKRVAIVSTGNELVEPGEPLKEGQVYYCTGPMLKALAEEAGGDVVSVAKIHDDEAAIVQALKRAESADVIIMIGGMAGGLFDYGRSAFEKIGVALVFFEGQWRPGKPLFFGTLGDKLVFGLPGNPVAAFVMFKIFVEPVISGRAIAWKRAHLRGDKPKPSPNTNFLRARFVDRELELVPGQGSHQLFNLALADAIVCVPPSDVIGEEFAYIAI